MTKSNFNRSPSMKSKVSNVSAVKAREGSSFKPAEGISPTNDKPSLENIDSSHSVLRVKVKQCRKYSCRVCDFATKKKSKYKDHIELHQNLNGKLFKKHLRARKNDFHETNNSLFINGHMAEVQPSSLYLSLDLDVQHLPSNSLFLPRSDSDEFVAEDAAAEQLSEDDNKLPKRKENENLDGKKSFSCNVCEFKTQHKQNLTRHVKIHTGDRPFKCTFSGCHYSSGQKENLDTHLLLIHSDIKPYSCQLCSERFCNRQYLNSHVRNHKGKKPICCPYNGCEFSCTSSSNLKRHMPTHTGGKPYHCNFEGCGLSFNKKHILKRHFGTHTGYRPYPCSFKGCNRSFRGSCDLKYHFLTHTGAKPFRCDFKDCKFSCSQSGKLKIHMLRHLTQNPRECPKCKRSRTLQETEQHLETYHEFQTTSLKGGHSEPIPPMPIGKNTAAEDITNVLSVQTQPPFSSPNNNERNSETMDEAKPRKKYLCAICDFESKSKKKCKAHLDSHEQDTIDATLEVSFTSQTGLISEENSSKTRITTEVVKKSAKVTKSPDNASKMNLLKHKTMKTMHYLKKQSEFQQVSSSNTELQPSLLLEPPATKSSVNLSRNRKTYLAKPRMQREEERSTSTGVEVSKVISPTHAQTSGVNNDSTQSASHTRIHTGDRPFSCTYSGCNYSATQKRNLTVHFRVHAKVKPYHCDFNDCKFSCAHPGHLKAHMLRHLTLNPHACPKCKFRSCSPLEIEQHLETFHKLQNTSHSGDLQPNAPIRETPAESPTNILPAQTQPSFSSQNNMEIFSETLDEARPIKKHVCATCDFQSKSHKKYKAHLEVHVEERQLSEMNATKLTKHQTSSKEGRDISSTPSQGKENSTALLRESKKSFTSFPCDFCKKSFAEEMKLLNHLRCHTGQKKPG